MALALLKRLCIATEKKWSLRVTVGDVRDPDYWDFVYFSFIIGTAAQTADVNIVSARSRRLVTVHRVIAFFFNTTILALTINVAASAL
jgi:uncharacterized membrane protein